MKLILEKNPEFNRLSSYFKKIEELAEKMGIDVDDLIQENRNKKASMYTSFKRSILHGAQKRMETLIRRRKGGSSPEENPAVGMTIITMNKQ